MRRPILLLCLMSAGLSFGSCTALRADCESADPTCSRPALLLYLLGCSPRLLGGRILACAPLNLTGTVSTFAGTGVTGFQDGAGATAEFSGPEGITTDGVFLYLTDSVNERVRRINIATREVSTLAGSGATGLLNGAAGVAQFNGPKGITTDGVNLYVMDPNNQQVRKVVIATGEVSTFAGSTLGFQDGPGASAQFSFPNGATTDGISLFVADTSNNRVRRVDLATQVVSTLAGDGVAGFNDGPGATARFNAPRGLTTDGFSLFVVEQSTSRVRKIDIATGTVSTVAGDGTAGFLDGPGLSAQFNAPFDITTDGQSLFVVDRTNHRIRQINIATGVVSTLAGDGGMGFMDGPGASAQFFFPFGITTDGERLFVGDSANERVRLIQ